METQNVRFQAAAELYARKWVRVVEIDEVPKHNYATETELIKAGIHISPLYTLKSNGIELPPAINLATGTLYWPRGAVDPYVLLHELVHMLTYAVTLDSPEWQSEDCLFTAIDYWSVAHLERMPGSDLNITDWVDWRVDSSDGDAADEIRRDAEKYLPELLDTMLFAVDKTGMIQPTFFPLHFTGEVQLRELEL